MYANIKPIATLRTVLLLFVLPHVGFKRIIKATSISSNFHFHSGICISHFSNSGSKNMNYYCGMQKFV